MELRLKEIVLPTVGLSHRTSLITRLENNSYVTQKTCPICASDDLSLISKVQTNEQSGLEVSFCILCEHIFFSRFPEQSWYSNYYSSHQDPDDLNDQNISDRLKHFVRHQPFIHKIWLKRVRLRHRSVAAVETMLRERITKASLMHLTRPNIHKALDIGCGLGGNLRLFKSLGLSPLGIDSSNKRVDYCNANGMTALEVPLDDIRAIKAHGPFDLISSSHVLEHISDLKNHISQIGELSHKDTYLYFEVPNTSQEHIYFRSFNPTHLHVFSIRSLSNLLSQIGFTIIRIIQDLNTHILAVRSELVSSQIECSGGICLKNYQRGFNQLRKAIGEPVSIEYASTYHTVIRNLGTDKELYRHHIGFPSKKFSEHTLLKIEGILGEGSQNQETDSLVFSSNTELAPIII